MNTDIQTALNRWAAGIPWHQAFGQTRRQYRANQRNEILKEVARLAAADASELRHLCHRFEMTVWPRWRHLTDSPVGAGQLHRLLHQARQYGPFPDSVRQYYAILKKYPT